MILIVIFFFFNDTATTEIYTLSLHDALPICWYPDLTYHDPPPEGVSMQDWYLARHMPLQVAEGLRYAREQTAWLDLRVIAQMIICVLARSWAPPKKRSPSADGRETS